MKRFAVYGGNVFSDGSTPCIFSATVGRLDDPMLCGIHQRERVSFMHFPHSLHGNICMLLSKDRFAGRVLIVNW